MSNYGQPMQPQVPPMSPQIDFDDVWRTYANAYSQLLGDDWTVSYRYTVTNGTVVIHAKTGTIEWLDLAPDGMNRERRSVRMPSGASIGAVTEVARVLAELSARTD